jgi:hypothetical protein
MRPKAGGFDKESRTVRAAAVSCLPDSSFLNPHAMLAFAEEATAYADELIHCQARGAFWTGT